MNKFLRYTLKILGWLAVIVVILMLAVFIYVSYHKKEIIAKVKTGVSEKLNGDVQIGNIDLNFVRNFPKISVLLENVTIKDTMYHVHKHSFLHAEKIYVLIGIGRTLQKDNPLTGIRIENAQLYLYTDTAGYTNAYLLSPKNNNDTATGHPASHTSIESIKLRNVRLVVDDQLNHKLHDFDVAKLNCKLDTDDSIITVATSGEVLIHSLAFNTLVGSYAKETPFEGGFEFTFDKAKKQLAFSNINVLLKGQQFNMTGRFTLSDQPTFALKVATKNVDYELAKSLLNPKIAMALSLVSLSKPVKEVFADVSGPLKGGEPLVKINWSIAETDVKSPFVSLDKCSLKGSFINEVVAGLPRTDPNSRLYFHNVSGLYYGIPVRSENAYIDNLLLPVVKCDIKSSFDLARMNDILQSNTLRLQQGSGELQINYSGPLQNNKSENTLMNGKLAVSNGVMLYQPRHIQIRELNFNIVFKNSDVFVNDFKGTVQGNKIMMNGSAKNLLALINTNPGRLLVDWNIYMPLLNLNDFTPLLQKRASVAPASRSTSKLGSTAQQIDEIVDYSNFRLNVQADELLFRKFKASKIKATLSLVNEDWILNNVSLQHAGGQMNIGGLLSQKNDNLYEARLNVNMDNVDVSRVMYAFENFGQSGIESDNLKGKLTTNTNIKFNIDRNTEHPSDMSGVVDFSIKNGALLHYEPLKQVQKIIFKKRNFDEIYFAELKDKIEIDGQDIKINRMEIQSTALTLFIEGLYSLNQKDKTDLSIQVPISNLKKRDDDYIPENKGTDARGGASIYLRGRAGNDGTVGFKLDVFKKLRKKKN